MDSLTAMPRVGAALFIFQLLALAGYAGKITIDYPEEGSIFPAEITAPTFLWRDDSASAKTWLIEVTFGNGSPKIQAKSQGERLAIGEIDPRVVSDTNEPPKLKPEFASGHSWKPDEQTWKTIKRHSTKRPATVKIIGLTSASVTIRTSIDPVGAPIFYRDVPLIPSETEKGVIKPLARSGIPLINWRLRNVSEPDSRILLTGMRTCANCHSFSRDGKTLGMDLDGPRNDKGLYALAPVKPVMSIRDEDVVKWTSFLGKQEGDLRIGFMSQVSPDGQHVVTMVNGANGQTLSEQSSAPRRRRKPAISNFYVANFKSYGFLQVFYPTGGILAWYSRAAAKMQPLPGADDARFVHTGATWSPNGDYLVFARAEAKEPYPAGQKMAEFANDLNETQIQYDLYRIPFDGGKGGKPEPIVGASDNGMSNSFPKVSPDGRWIVYVQARNGQLMRPDSQLYIVPATGGKPRRMRCNTSLMNSWHSFSPNGRWLAFSSKARSPYTQLYLTHIDANGNDSPAILVENTTAANRAVNIPEFVNVAPDGLQKIDVPAVEFYRIFDLAWELADKGKYDEAIPEWRKALQFSPSDARVHMNLGMALVRVGKTDEGTGHYQRALEIDPNYPEAHMNLGIALAEAGKLDEAIGHYQKALEGDPEFPEALNNLGAALAAKGKLDEAIPQYQKALELNPKYPEVHNNLAVVLARNGKLNEAIDHFQQAAELKPSSGEFHNNLVRALTKIGRADEIIPRLEKLLQSNPAIPELHNSLGVVLAQNRQSDGAIRHFEEALRLNPDFVDAHYNLGDTLYYLAGKPADALQQWREVLRLQPNHVPVLDKTARALATCPDRSLRDGAEAVRLAERAVELSKGREPAILDTLASAYAESGRHSEAAETARRAEELKSKIALHERQITH